MGHETDDLREKVIEHLADCVEYLDGDSSRHWVFVRGNAVRAALQLLKAQEPRVMLQTEVMMESNALYEGCVWLETRYGSLAPCFIGFEYQGEIKIYSPFLHPAKAPESNETWWGIEHYGHIWRCWTSRPTDEQQKEAEWE